MPEQDGTQETAEAATDEVQQDQTTDADETAEESQEDEATEAWDPERAKRKITKVNSENRALRERATKAEEKAASVDDLQKQNGDLTVANLQLMVGYELGLPIAIAQRLRGDTREEMLADAETLVELVAPTKRPPTRKPAESLRGGGDPEQEPEETDLRKIGDRMFQH